MKLELSKHVLFEDSVSSSRCSFLLCKWFSLFHVGSWPPAETGPLVASLGSGNLRSSGPSHGMLLAMRRSEKVELGILVFCGYPPKTFGRFTGGYLFA